MYKIIGDSCTDLTGDMKKTGRFRLVPLMLSIGNKFFKDDKTFKQKEFIEEMKKTEECPKSACPSPESFIEAYDNEDENFVVTLSSKLSGSYGSAELAKKIYLEDHPDKKIEVIDSRSASVGQTLIAMKIDELKRQGFSFNEVKEAICRFRDGLHTKFVLESVENLRRNGRLSNIAALICNVLNIKPVLCGMPDGSIQKLDQARGTKAALKRMIESIEKDVTDAKDRILGIAQCNCFERALALKEEIMKRIPFKDCIIVDTAGVSTLYADDGGIIVVY